MSRTPVELLEAAVDTMQHAYAPYSGYAVGAALATPDDRVFSGCNVENASYGLTICAERAAVFSAVSAGERTFLAAAIVTRGDVIPHPCGSCRQVLAEFCDPEMPVYVARADALAEFEEHTLSDLLPHTFKLKDTQE